MTISQLETGLPRSKREAEDQGVERYFTGRPCKRGHVTQRYTSTANCVDCALAYSDQRRKHQTEIDPLYNRRRILWGKYRLTVEEADPMLEQQQGLCAVCRHPFGETPFVDHCHLTNRVRDLLCRGCNTALGYARDNPTVLRALADYVERHQSKSQVA